MDDRFTKYSKLYFLVFLVLLAVPVAFALLIATFYGFSTIISSRPVDIIFELVVIGIPSAVFATAHYIFFKRTKQHPSVPVKIISQILFLIGICCSLFFLALSIIAYFKKGYNNITDYLTFHIAFLAGNIGGLFLIAIIQAFTTKKEEDWMEKRNKMSR
jgi:membrane associated rhomboid family serine protease